MVKKHTSIRVEEEYLKILRINGIKLSPLIDEYLREYVKLLDLPEKELVDKRIKLINRIDKDKITLKDINKRLFELYEEEG